MVLTGLKLGRDNLFVGSRRSELPQAPASVSVAAEAPNGVLVLWGSMIVLPVTISWVSAWSVIRGILHIYSNSIGVDLDWSGGRVGGSSSFSRSGDWLDCRLAFSYTKS